jgi:hypothetical protein
VRFVDFLRVSVLLFGGAASALAAVAIIGVARDANTALAAVAVGWWVTAALVGAWLGRRPAVSPGIARLLAAAKTARSLPELEPGAVLFNRLWALAVFTLVAGGVGVLIPQVPAIAAGYGLLVALTWRNQSGAVAAIEDRDGVRFYFDRSSPFGPPRLLRTPWARKIEPEASAAEAESDRERASGWAPLAGVEGATRAAEAEEAAAPPALSAGSSVAGSAPARTSCSPPARE